MVKVEPGAAAAAAAAVAAAAAAAVKTKRNVSVGSVRPTPDEVRFTRSIKVKQEAAAAVKKARLFLCSECSDCSPVFSTPSVAPSTICVLCRTQNLYQCPPQNIQICARLSDSLGSIRFLCRERSNLSTCCRQLALQQILLLLTRSQSINRSSMQLLNGSQLRL
jgi:hypothetical protein